MGVYDQAARWAAQAESEAVVQRALRETGLRLRFREWVKSRTTPPPGETDRTADQVAALDDERCPDQPWLLLVGFSRPTTRRSSTSRCRKQPGCGWKCDTAPTVRASTRS